MTMQDDNEKIDLFKSLTTPELGIEVILQTSPLSPHEMTRSEVEERVDNLTLIESEVHQRMESIRNVNQDVNQNPYLATVSPLVSGELNEEFSELRNLDSQVNSLRHKYESQIQTWDLQVEGLRENQALVDQIEAPLRAHIEQLEQQHSALMDTATDAVTAMGDAQSELASKGQSVSSNWRDTSDRIAQRLRTFNTPGYEQLTGEQQMDLSRTQARSAQVMGNQSTPATSGQKETSMTTEKKSFGAEIASEAPIMARLISDATSKVAKAASQVKEIGSTTHTTKM